MKCYLYIFLLLLSITFVSAGIYSDETIYGVSTAETTTTTGGGGEEITCEDCDDRFVNTDGDTMTGNLTLDSDLVFDGSQVIDVKDVESPTTINFINSLNDLIGYFHGTFGVIGDFIATGTGIFGDDVYVGIEGESEADIIVNGNITADYFFGDGSQLSGISGGNSSWNQSYADTLYYSIDNPSGFYNSSNFVIGDYYNKTQVYNNTANINATGYNITADYFFGDGSQLTGISSGDGTGGWINDSSQTNTSLNVSITGGQLKIYNGHILFNISSSSNLMMSQTSENVFKITNGTSPLLSLGEDETYLSDGIPINDGSFDYTLIGKGAGNLANDIDNSIFIGYKTGELYNGTNPTDTSGESLFIGSGSGYYALGSSMVGLGKSAFQSAGRDIGGTGSAYSVGIGALVGYGSDGIANLLMGYVTGFGIVGDSNIYLGGGAGFYEFGDNNLYLGNSAGFSSLAGANPSNRVIAIGYEAGRDAQSNDSIYIGYESGENDNMNDVFILKQNNINSNPLIWGNFSSGFIGLNTTSPVAPLEVNLKDADGNLSIKTAGGILADAYFEFSEVYDEEYLNPDGSVNHSKHPCYAGEIEVNNYSAPIYEEVTHTECQRCFNETSLDSLDIYGCNCSNITEEVLRGYEKMMQPILKTSCRIASMEQVTKPTILEDNRTAIDSEVGIFEEILTNTPTDKRTDEQKKQELDELVLKEELRNGDGKLTEIPLPAESSTEKASWSISGMVDWLYENLIGHEKRIRDLEKEVADLQKQIEELKK